MNKKYGFDFSQANYNGLMTFENKFSEHESVMNYILADTALTVAARNIFKSPQNAAYPFLLSMRAGKIKKDGTNGQDSTTQGEATGEAQAEVGNQEGGATGTQGEEDKGPADSVVSGNEGENVTVIVKPNTITSDVEGGTWSGKPDVRSFGQHAFLSVVIASHIVIEDYGVADYLLKKDPHCIVRETLQTLYHATKYLNGFEVMYNKRVARVLLAGKWYNVGLLTRMDEETNTTVFLIQHGRRYAALTRKMFTEFVRDYSTGVKIGKSSVKLEDMNNAKNVMVSMVSDLVPDLTQKVKRTF